MSLSLVDVRKSYRQPNGEILPVLNIARYALQQGEQAVLLGPSGGGKSTLLNVISGITRADSGQIVVDGTDISRLREEARDRFRALKIGFVFQTFNLLPAFTALENVLLGMSFCGKKADTRWASSLLDKVGLSHRLTHKPGNLSVGEQQRVAVARALCNTPRLLLADEPTANVDVNNQQKILDLLRETCREMAVSLLIVTHSLEVAGQFQRVDRLSEFNQPGTTA